MWLFQLVETIPSQQTDKRACPASKEADRERDRETIRQRAAGRVAGEEGSRTGCYSCVQQGSEGVRE